MKWDWATFWLGAFRSFMIGLGIWCVDPSITDSFWRFTGALFFFMIAMESSVHIVLRDIAKEDEKSVD